VNKAITELNDSGKNAEHYKYVLITPARNEEAFIELTIKSVVSQTIPPVKWVIVSDGSTDRTDDIVKKYTTEYNWIELVRMSERAERHFAGKVYAFNTGYERVQDIKYDIVGSLDADISFDDPEYFDFLLKKFIRDPTLGVAGTPFREGEDQYDYRFTSTEHVSGACQLFRRECFESIGGYVPLEVGGIDLVAVTSARMRGWKTRTFTAKACVHHRRMGTANYSLLIGAIKGGYHDYLMGVHPVWQVFRSFYQMRHKPYIIFGAALLVGYFWAMLLRAKRPISMEFVLFRQKEQMRRLKEYFEKILHFR
jgi:poly-beta-1,6-N-acetyl-D-glucosamine synthase